MKPETTDAEQDEPTGGMLGAGVGAFLRNLAAIAEHHSGQELIQALHDGADAIVIDVYTAMCDALESEGL